MDRIELIGELKKQAQELPTRDFAKLDALRRRAEMIIRNVFSAGSKYIQEFQHLDFTPNVYPTTPQREQEAWRNGHLRALNLIDTMEEELRLFAPAQSEPRDDQARGLSRQLFIVHGHDEEMKQHVARILLRLDFEPIILHEKPNQGRTIIEKFSDYSRVSFAVVLLSPDDLARPRDASSDELRSRARQNVVLELGYFLGKLGRDKVVVLYREKGDFEMPSDYSGVLFVPFDSQGRWQFDLVRELKASGYEVDANRLL